LSRISRTVPVALPVEEMKTQPSLERANVKSLLDCEGEETTSSSETRLFSLYSPEKSTSASATPARPRIAMVANRFLLINKERKRGADGSGLAQKPSPVGFDD